jgi:sterol desaturase/sphingolipid hydroxylase (fatty acid hydroxylase superfamily)
MSVSILSGFVVGLVGWTFLEYTLHRFAFHEKKLGNRVSRDHLKHHAKVDWFAPFRIKAFLALVILGPIVLAVALVGGWFAAMIPAGIVAGWIFYEVLHRRIHVSAPFGAYGRWARRHHLAHHFGHATKNHGVTSPIWDHVFGTFEAVSEVTVPRLHAKKFPWLLEDPKSDRPAVAQIWAPQYRIV